MLTDAAFPAEPYIQLDTPKPFLTSITTKNDGLSPLVTKRTLEHLLGLLAYPFITGEAVSDIVSCAPKIRCLITLGSFNLTNMTADTIQVKSKLSTRSMHFFPSVQMT